MVLPASARRDAAVIGDHVRRWRLVRELPAADVAERAGVSLSTLRAIERGEGENVRLGALLSIVRVLGVSEPFLDSLEPLHTEIGKLRADRMTRKRAPR